MDQTAKFDGEPTKSPKAKRRSIRGRRSSILVKAPTEEEQELMEVSMKQNVHETTSERLTTANCIKDLIKNYALALSKESAEWTKFKEIMSNNSLKEKNKHQNEMPLAENGCLDARPARLARSQIMKLLSKMRAHDDSGILTQEHQRLDEYGLKLNEDIVEENEKITQLLDFFNQENTADLSRESDFWKNQLDWSAKAQQEIQELANLLTI